MVKNREKIANMGQNQVVGADKTVGTVRQYCGAGAHGLPKTTGRNIDIRNGSIKHHQMLYELHAPISMISAIVLID